MIAAGYEIAHFRPEHEPQVLEVVSDLWKYDHNTRVKLFRWKHLENPYADGPLGIVALHKGRVVGFRGYFANRFVLVGHNNNIGVLHPGDTCVDPSHRNKGLSVAMGNLAMQYNTSKYRLFLNMSCSKNSLPGYLAMGFQPLAKKIRLIQHSRSPLRWVQSYWSKRQSRVVRPLREGGMRLGRFGNILITDSPLPAEMASIIASQGHANAVLRPHQDQTFFAWRFRNPAQNYVFFFLLDGDTTRGFVVMDVTANNLSGEILDYGECSDGAVREILSYVCASRNFKTLSVFSYGVDERLRKVLTDLRFSAVHSLQTLMRKGSVEERARPLLIRPIKKSYTDQDFLIEGVDVRKIESWRLKPICSDGA